ncbi:MAG: four helix bundle protein [Cyanosarcina radialis HA8281-LM2]|jgi:four helix bundle protein|nr:four helix bundle protein [Cyanosarcina radialis HA8281-LM2]
MNEQEFKQRTKQLGLRIIRLIEALPEKTSAQVIGKQLLRSGTSVGANYRAACRAKSTADILHKLSIVEEEGDETLYWLELLAEAEIVPESKLKSLMAETDEIVAMVVIPFWILDFGFWIANRLLCLGLAKPSAQFFF